MRRILLSALKLVVSVALLYFALRKADFSDLASRVNIASLGWVALAIAIFFVQIVISSKRWCIVSAECGAPLQLWRAARYVTISQFFNQMLPSSIGGDAMRLWLVARGGAGWRVATYSILVDRAVGLIALAFLILCTLPWTYQLVTDAHGRNALIFVDLAALGAASAFLLLSVLHLPWLERWWGSIICAHAH